MPNCARIRLNMERRGVHQDVANWGVSPISHFLAENFDKIADTENILNKLEEAKIYTSYLLDVIASKHGIDKAKLGSIEINIVHRRTDEQECEVAFDEPELSKIKNLLDKEFGHEVTRRLTISLSDGSEI